MTTTAPMKNHLSAARTACGCGSAGYSASFPFKLIVSRMIVDKEYSRPFYCVVLVVSVDVASVGMVSVETVSSEEVLATSVVVATVVLATSTAVVEASALSVLLAPIASVVEVSTMEDLSSNTGGTIVGGAALSGTIVLDESVG